ncbi:MAG: hypothetical protein HQK79_01870 [Desulfobacterales bacterium]|nr:hypothetical protein [Desulfobacterales bacterium]MBF0397314.1 hypothetical protein [Desulfobacterales bacterium]
MRKREFFYVLIVLTLLLPSIAGAWGQPHHKYITSDALAYMGSDYATPEQKRAFDFFVGAAGSLQKAQELLGQAAYDVDSFKDTRMGGWWVGYHYTAEDLSIGLMSNNYTSLWHFVNMTRGKDAHNNDRGGYDYRYSQKAFEDTVVMVWLYNQELKKDDYNSTEAHYRNASYSTWDQYKDFQVIPFQPVDNLGYYWFKQFVSYQTFQALGYASHAVGDVAVAQHVWNTMGKRHSQYEEWAQDHHYSDKLGDFALVHDAIVNYNTKEGFLDILNKTSQAAYENPTPMYTGTYDAQLVTAKVMVPKAIASVVTILTKSVNILHGEDRL